MFVAVMLFCGNAFAQTVLINDDFEAYTVGNKIAVEAQAAGNDWWTTWSNNPGSAEDGVIATEGGSKCGHLTYNNDQVLLCGGIESGAYDLEFDILVPNGKNGYFNILHNFNGGASTWAMQAYLHLTNDGSVSTAAPGHGTIHAGSNSTADIPCVYDEWMHFRLHVDSDTDTAEFFYSTESNPTEQSLCTWQWSLDSFGQSQVGRKLDAMDFFPPENAATSEYYLDNFKLTQIGGDTAPVISFDTDEIEAWVAEDEADAVDINISNEEGTSIADWTAWIDFGQGEGGSTAPGQIHYDAEPSDNSTFVGFGNEEPTLYEIAAMIPGSSYAGAAMGTDIISVQYLTSLTGFEVGTPLTFRVYSQGLNGQPGEVLAEKVVAYNQINDVDWTIATFDAPVALTGYNVWIACEYTQAVTDETTGVGYAMAFDKSGYQPNSGYFRTNGGGAFQSLGPDNLSADYGCLHLRANFIGTPVPATWATLSKPEGSMPIGGTDEVTVNLNTIGLSAGDVYNADIIFKTNDPEKPVVEIPLTLTVSGASVAENTENLYKVYPNPTKGMVVVEGENIVAVSVYNAAGQLINVVKSTNEKTTVEMNEAGVYFLSIIDNAGNSTIQRVVVE